MPAPIRIEAGSAEVLELEVRQFRAAQHRGESEAWNTERLADTQRQRQAKAQGLG